MSLIQLRGKGTGFQPMPFGFQAIYTAATLAEAEQQLSEFEQKWGKNYPDQAQLHLGRLARSPFLFCPF
jgi:hypothetical protein